MSQVNLTWCPELLPYVGAQPRTEGLSTVHGSLQCQHSFEPVVKEEGIQYYYISSSEFVEMRYLLTANQFPFAKMTNDLKV